MFSLTRNVAEFGEYNLKILGGLMRGLFAKDEPEDFSKESLNLIGFSKFAELNEEEHLRLLEELTEIKAVLRQFKIEILTRLDESPKGIRPPSEDFTKNELIEAKTVPDLIKDILSKGTKSFSELLEATQVTAPTLSKYLSKMVEQGTVERIETDRKVLYRLKGRSDG